MATPITFLSAVTLVVRDMRASVAWYEALGFERRYGGADAFFTSYAVGAGYLNLEASGGAAEVRRSGWGRIVFHVADVDALHARAVGAGLRPEATPRNAEWGERYFHVLDPDGHELSFARPLEGAR